ncbi:MAG TPA: bacteriocin [Lacunisphaera sp.]|nr:bacteriocin [Lacunisphaera sp.]
MKELTMSEYDQVAGGLAPVTIALLGATFLWAESHWSEIKHGFADGWNDGSF